MKNPYARPPYPNEMADAWWLGFLRGYADQYASHELPLQVAESEGSAFIEGIQAGRHAGIDGLSLGDTCIAAGEGSEATEMLSTRAWGTWSVGSKFFATGGPAGLVARGLVSLLRLALHTRHTANPEWVLPQLVQPLLGEMERAGVRSCELYLGIGRDPSVVGCEFLATGLYPSIEGARGAVERLGRRDWFIAGWRTDQSNSFRVVEYS